MTANWCSWRAIAAHSNPKDILCILWITNQIIIKECTFIFPPVWNNSLLLSAYILHAYMCLHANWCSWQPVGASFGQNNIQLATKVPYNDTKEHRTLYYLGIVRRFYFFKNLICILSSFFRKSGAVLNCQTNHKKKCYIRVLHHF